VRNSTQLHFLCFWHSRYLFVWNGRWNG